jgi:hypothetical protein
VSPALPQPHPSYPCTDPRSIYILPPPIEDTPTNSRKRQAGKGKGKGKSAEDEAEEQNPWWMGEIVEVRARNETNVFM